MTTLISGSAARPVASITVMCLITSGWDQPLTLHKISRMIRGQLKGKGYPCKGGGRPGASRGTLGLSKARDNFASFGAVERICLPKVRQPLPSEL
jgi:hypothetical protein